MIKMGLSTKLSRSELQIALFNFLQLINKIATRAGSLSTEHAENLSEIDARGIDGKCMGMAITYIRWLDTLHGV